MKSAVIYYVLGAVATLAVGASIGACYSREIKKAGYSIASKVMRADEEFRNCIPKPVVNSWDWIASKHHGKSPEELEQERKNHIKGLEAELERLNKESE